MKIGIIGCGHIADGHATVYKYTKDAKVVAVSDISSQKAKIFADKHGIGKVFADHLSLLEIKDLDFVDICTPTSTHAHMACDAAEFGHNILLEKPMALSTDECDNIIHKVEKNGVSLCVCHNQIFFPSIRRAKSMVNLGRYDLVSFRTCVKQSPQMFSYPAWNMTPEEKGILWEAGCHLAYLQLHFLKNVTEVYAVGSKVKYPVYDNFSVILRTSGRSYGIIEVSWVTNGSEKTYEIDRADGKRILPLVDGDYHLVIEKPEAGGAIHSEIRRASRYFLRSRQAGHSQLGYFIGHFFLINEYIRSLKDGSPPPVQAGDGKRTIRLLECMEESLDNHKIVSVE
jgi:predicted dehydrogenase